MKIYLAGSVPKGNEEAKTFSDWRKKYQKVLEGTFHAEFIDPSRSDIMSYEGDSLMIVGIDCWYIKNSNLIIVNAEDKLGAGTAQELVVAKYFKLPVITVLPKNTYHRRSNIMFHNTLIKDWVHPFIDTLSDIVVERVEDIAGLKDKLEIMKVKDMTIIDQAIEYSQRRVAE